jgi:hypothetical protein
MSQLFLHATAQCASLCLLHGSSMVIRMWFRYLDDCEKVIGVVPAFEFPCTQTTGEGAYASCAMASTQHPVWTKVDYTNKDNAIASMLQSLRGCVLSLMTNSMDTQKAIAALPASALGHDLAQAVERQAGFYYQVSLPHYRDTKFLNTAVNRCSCHDLIQLT